ncbi:MAG: NAD-binding protein [Candidatus Hodarchaeota archaeon]
MNKKFVKLKILLRHNWFAIAIIVLWFAVNFFVFYMWTGFNLAEALLITFYFTEMPTYYGNFYLVLSGFVIFGILFSFITIELYRKYNPKETSLILARAMNEHTVVIGYSHLGHRIREFLVENKRKYVIVEEDEELVSDLIEEEEPIVTGKMSIDLLRDARIERAKLVLITKRDLETQVVAAGLIRDLNKECRIICRFFDDSIADVIEKTYQIQTISTSRFASEYILSEYILDDSGKTPIKNVLMIGCTNTARRLSRKLKDNNIKYVLIERDREKAEDFLDREPIIIGDAKDEVLLEMASIDNVDMVIIFIDTVDELLLIADKVREMNKDCRLVCRFFHEEVAEILEKPPFNAKNISTSLQTLRRMIKEGMLDIK